MIFFLISRSKVVDLIVFAEFYCNQVFSDRNWTISFSESNTFASEDQVVGNQKSNQLIFTEHNSCDNLLFYFQLKISTIFVTLNKINCND